MRSKYLLILCLLGYELTFGQVSKFDYLQNIEDVQPGWNHFELPVSIFENTQNDFSDIRIYGITKAGDTLEAPFEVTVDRNKQQARVVEQKAFNKSHNVRGYYATIENPGVVNPDEIELNIDLENFDFRLQVDGSNDQKNWFTIVEGHRILGIHNNQTHYRFTKISIPESRYKYYRFHEEGGNDPKILSAKISKDASIKGTLTQYQPTSMLVVQKPDTKQTLIEVDLGKTIPIERLQILISDAFDYYRPIEIQILQDSFKTDFGLKYTFQTILNSTLSSLEQGVFSFDLHRANKMCVVIENQDNQALSIKSVNVSAYAHMLKFKAEEARYVMAYGGNRTASPHYDITHFKTEAGNLVQLGKIESITHKAEPTTEALFINKNWLWAIMILIIGLLGWFTVGMLRKA